MLDNKVALDFETYLIDNNNIYPKPVCVSSYNGKDAFLFRKGEMFEFIKDALESKIIIAHNATFECGVIYYHFPELRDLMFKALDEGRIICTMINEQLINITREKPNHSVSLASLVQAYFKKDISETKTEDSWRLRYAELEEVDNWPQEAIDYALFDSIYAFELYEKQEKMNIDLSVSSSVYLNIMASKGINLDEDRVQALKKEIMDYLDPRYYFLIEKEFCVRDYDNPKKVKKCIKLLKDYVEAQGFELRYTKKGSISVDAESLEFYLNQKDDEIIRSFSELAIYEKALTAYISNLEVSPIIYSTYSSTKSTGRTSSSKSALFPSVNIQQMPRGLPNVSYDIRNCFIPRDGFKILSIDYAGLELCSTAHQLYKLFKKSKMRDALNEGSVPTDMHSKLAARIKGISYEEFMAKKKEYKDFRQLAKPINLGFPGGIGYDTMRYLLWKDGIKTKFEVLHRAQNKKSLQYYLWQLQGHNIRIARLNKKEWGLVQDDLVKFKRDFFDLYPELEEFLKRTHLRFVTGAEKWVKNDFDEWEKEPMYAYDIYGFKRDWCTYTAFCNGYLMQTPSAIGAKKAVNKIVRLFHDHPDIRPLAFIHDEILFEIKENRKDLAEDAGIIMVNEMQSVLDTVRVTVEMSMSDYWQKADGFWTQQYWNNQLRN